MGISLQTVFGTLQTYLGSVYERLQQFGRTYQVRLQSPTLGPCPRTSTSSGCGQPTAAWCRWRRWRTWRARGAASIVRFNPYPSAAIKGRGARRGRPVPRDHRAGQGSDAPGRARVAWNGLSYQEKEASGGAGVIFLLAIFLVFLKGLRSTSPGCSRGDHPGGPAGAPGRSPRHDAHPFREQRLHPDRHRAAHRAHLEERDPDRGVRGSSEVGPLLSWTPHRGLRLRFRPILMTVVSFVFGTAPLVLATGPARARAWRSA